MLNSVKARVAALAAALLMIFFLIASFGLLPIGRDNRIKPDKTFAISVDQGDKTNSRYEIKITNELPYEASISSVLVVVRSAALKVDPAYPVKVEALPFPKNGGRVDPSYQVRLKPGQSQRFNLVFPEAVSQSSEIPNMEIQVKAAAIGGDNRPYVVYTIRHPKVMENTT